MMYHYVLLIKIKGFYPGEKIIAPEQSEDLKKIPR
jgi:hypothetical protein